MKTLSKTVVIIFLISFVLSMFLSVFSGCITQKKCSERFPIASFEKDSTTTTIKTRTVAVNIPGEKIEIHDTIPCPYEYKKEVKKNNLTARVIISKGILKVDCISDSLQKLLEVKDSIINRFRSEVKEPKEVTKFKEHWYTTPLIWYFIITLLIAIIILLYSRIKK